jgi:putative transposase
VTERDASRLSDIQALKAEHPFWGERRIWAYLHFVEQLPINKKRVLRVMREHNLLVKPNLQFKAKRTPSRSKPRPTTAPCLPPHLVGSRSHSSAAAPAGLRVVQLINR